MDTMQLSFVQLISGVLLVDWLFIFLTRAYLDTTVNTWYDNFGILAVVSDTSVIALAILLSMFLYRGSSFLVLCAVALGVQIVHDVVFNMLVIQPTPPGRNGLIDMFKTYTATEGYKAIVGDGMFILATVLAAKAVSYLPYQGQLVSILFSVYMIPYALTQKRIPSTR